MAELATIARPYAEALFKAAGSALDGTAAWLDELAAIAADPQLRQFADHPKVSEQQVVDLIAGVAKTTWPDLASSAMGSSYSSVFKRESNSA